MSGNSIVKDKQSIIELKEYIEELRTKSKTNKKSNWLNFIAFFIPIIGVFWVFYYLLKSPIRSKSLLKTIVVSIGLQISFFFFCYFFLFNYLGNLCINLFG